MLNSVINNLIKSSNSIIPSSFFRSGMLVIVTLLLSNLAAFAQDKNDLGTEVVNIVKPYSPTISDAFKVKETPSLNDSITTAKKKVEYSIFSVPVASTFTPAKGKASNVEKSKPLQLFDNYATLGFGNYTSILGELYSNFELSRTDNVGLYFRHNSSQGGIDGVLLDDKFYDTSLDANYTSRQKDASYRLEVGVENETFNWYGLNESFNSITEESLATIDPKHSYTSGYAGGSVGIEASYFEKLSANVRYLGDSYSSSEFNFSALSEFSFPISDLSLKVDVDLDYLGGSFDRGYLLDNGIKYSLFNAGVLPSLVYINNDLTFTLGAAAFVGLDSENSNTDFFIYPRINVSYRLIDELLIAYGGIEGTLEQNTYYDFKEENPFVSPSLYIAPSNTMYDAFGGIKGKFTNSIGYNLRASYKNVDNQALFRLNEFTGLQGDGRGYAQGNSFKVVYDDIQTLSVCGELNVEVNKSFSLGITGTYNNYNTEGEMQAWNLPSLKASLFANFNITEEFYGGLSFFYVGKRKDLYTTGGPLFDPINNAPVEVNIDGYVDVNLHLGYRLNDQLSIFAKGSNLFDNSYQKWANYKVYGIQGLLGATYKFDW